MSLPVGEYSTRLFFGNRPDANQVHACVCACMRACTLAFPSAHAHVGPCVHAYVCALLYACVHVCAHACVQELFQSSLTYPKFLQDEVAFIVVDGAEPFQTRKGTVTIMTMNMVLFLASHMHARMRARTHARMHARMHIRMHVCMHAQMMGAKGHVQQVADAIAKSGADFVGLQECDLPSLSEAITI